MLSIAGKTEILDLTFPPVEQFPAVKRAVSGKGIAVHHISGSEIFRGYSSVPLLVDSQKADIGKMSLPQQSLQIKLCIFSEGSGTVGVIFILRRNEVQKLRGVDFMEVAQVKIRLIAVFNGIIRESLDEPQSAVPGQGAVEKKGIPPHKIDGQGSGDISLAFIIPALRLVPPVRHFGAPAQKGGGVRRPDPVHLNVIEIFSQYRTAAIGKIVNRQRQIITAVIGKTGGFCSVRGNPDAKAVAGGQPENILIKSIDHIILANVNLLIFRNRRVKICLSVFLPEAGTENRDVCIPGQGQHLFQVPIIFRGQIRKQNRAFPGSQSAAGAHSQPQKKRCCPPLYFSLFYPHSSASCVR